MKKQVLSRRKHLKRQFKKSLELKQDIAGYKPTLAVAAFWYRKLNGLLFNNNSESDFLNKFNQLINLSHSEKNIIKINAKKKVQNFSIFRHYQKLYKILMD